MKGIFKFTRQSLLFIFVFFTLASPALASEKKGVGLFNRHAPERIEALNVSWYYTWSHLPVEGVSAEKFVPMLRSRGGRLLDEQIKYFRTQGKIPTLLLLNEPNMSSGDNMSAEETIRIWPEISALADSVSGPGTAGGRVSEPWFDKFYRMANARNLKFDFMAVHIYTPPDAKAFLERLDAIYEKYQKPIWLTEFAARDVDSARWRCKVGCKNKYSEEEVLAFMKIVLPELEKRQFVVRYAWFGATDQKHLSANEQVRTSRLFDKDGNLTALGKYYAEFQ